METGRPQSCDWSETSINEETGRISDKPQKLEEGERDSPLVPLEGEWPCPHFNARLPASRL